MLLRIFPAAGSEPGHPGEALQQVYLDESLSPPLTGSREADGQATPLVYANFLSSIDGRIAVADNSVDSGMATPEAIRSDVDWDLFCQLQASADVLVTHGGYLRSLANGELGNVLALPSDHSKQYLHEWRVQRELRLHPGVLVVSRSLQFDEQLLNGLESDVRVLTVSSASSERLNCLRNCGIHVDLADQSIGSADVINSLKAMQARSAYLQTGPRMFHMLAGDGCVDRLYLTMDLSLVGGTSYKSIIEGDLLGGDCRVSLRTLYSSIAGAESETAGALSQQLYAAFDIQ